MKNEKEIFKNWIKYSNTVLSIQTRTVLFEKTQKTNNDYIWGAQKLPTIDKLKIILNRNHYASEKDDML
jgi:hypothetical protein